MSYANIFPNTDVEAKAAYLVSGFCRDCSAMAVIIQPGATVFTRPSG